MTTDAEELIERLREAWQPIETAPKDGTDFVALISRGRRRFDGRHSWRVLECYWERGMRVPRFIWQGWSTDKETAPVLWMPLPPTQEPQP